MKCLCMVLTKIRHLLCGIGANCLSQTSVWNKHLGHMNGDLWEVSIGVTPGVLALGDIYPSDSSGTSFHLHKLDMGPSRHIEIHTGVEVHSKIIFTSPPSHTLHLLPGCSRACAGNAAPNGQYLVTVGLGH